MITPNFIVTSWDFNREPLYFMFNSLKAAIDHKIGMEIMGFTCELYAKIDFQT